MPTSAPGPGAVEPVAISESASEGAEPAASSGPAFETSDPGASEFAPNVAPGSLTWKEAVEVEAATLEAAYPEADIRIMVLDSSGSDMLADHGDVDRRSPIGDTTKPVAIYAALGEGLDPAMTFDTSKPVVLDGLEVRDERSSGVLTLSQAIAGSSNVAVAQVLEMVPWKAVYARVAYFLPIPESGRETLQEVAGQLIGFTCEVPLRDLGRAYARMVAEPDSAAIVDVLRLAVGPDATGARAAVPGLDVLGKTGTAGDPGNRIAVFIGRVSDGETTAWIGVSVGGAGKGEDGGSVAAPAFARIARAVLGGS
ncbi:MAG: penicillin-binding transpeptidase domain-containing protein [Myxococcota bacterium]